MNKYTFSIPGSGWDTDSIVSGYIKLGGHDQEHQAVEVIARFEFDPKYPFTNIFWSGSPARYDCPIIGFCGSYKQIEEDWNEWLWKFSQLLSRMDATEAWVNLDCIFDWHLRWKLQPKFLHEHGQTRSHGTMVGQPWGITVAPENDFSINSEWLAHFNRGWDKFVERWPESPQ